MKKMTNQIFSK